MLMGLRVADSYYNCSMSNPSAYIGREPLIPVQSYGFSTLTPLRFEADIYDCEVLGAIPRELRGSFFRCGGDTAYPTLKNDNVNNGDGMMAVFHFEDGQVDFRQRYVKTERFVLERKNRRRHADPRAPETGPDGWTGPSALAHSLSISRNNALIQFRRRFRRLPLA